MKSSLLLVSLLILLSSCASIDLQEVEPNKLDAEVELLQTPTRTRFDLFLSRGIFDQPVRLGSARAFVERDDAVDIELVEAKDSGRYGYRSDSTAAITALTLETVGRISFPEMSRFELYGKELIAGERFYKDDTITLSLPESLADQRFIVATATCGSQQISSEREIPIDQNEIRLKLDRLMSQLNQAAEADLNGIIPVTFAVEERYQPNWPAPFEVRSIATRDETQFTVDTSGFRFQAKVQVQVSNQFFFSFQNQNWPVQYCY